MLRPGVRSGWHSSSPGESEQSEASLRKAVELDPRLLSAAHNLAITLRRLDRPEEALEVVDEAMRAGLSAPESKNLRAHLLGDLGQFDEAVQSYQALIAERPGAIDAQETLARLLPQLGRTDEAMNTYEEALRRAPTIELYRSALNAAWDIKQAEALKRWSADAIRRFGGSARPQDDGRAGLRPRRRTRQGSGVARAARRERLHPGPFAMRILPPPARRSESCRKSCAGGTRPISPIRPRGPT